MLRAMEIRDEQGKMGYYVGIVEERFGKSRQSEIMAFILKITVQSYISKLSSYHAKKLAFLAYYLESNSRYGEEVPPSNVAEALLKRLGGRNCCTFLR